MGTPGCCSVRKQMAELTVAYWHACQVEAAKLHPNWTVSVDGTSLNWLGGRKGPRTPRTLLNWFTSTHPDKAAQIQDRFVAMLRFSGHVTTRRKRQH
jgi:hypothetical protein